MDRTGLQEAETDAFKRVPLDIMSIAPGLLNLAGRQRTNPFPWRGQFSPELVELLLANYGPSTGTVLDPFSGVGTTLWEAARRGLHAVGTEINPAAVTMAESVRFVPVTLTARRTALSRARARLAEISGDQGSGPLFSASVESNGNGHACSKRTLASAIYETQDDLQRIALANTLLRAMESEPANFSGALFASFDSYAAAIMDLPYASTDIAVHHTDARNVPVADGAIDFALTSPPYINVFNYHQNGRAAMEALGWDLLRVARSEFGSNRKNRGNRFLTVIQYALDMSEWLMEMHRVLSPTGRLIVVIGRESNVRGVAFRNGALLAALAERFGFTLTMRQERGFVTRFGEPIIEDILHLRRAPQTPSGVADDARSVAVAALKAAQTGGLPCDVANDLRDAIHGARAVEPSPLLRQERTPCPTP